MSSRRSGLSEPSRHVSNLWRMGTVIRIATASRPKGATMMISALVSREIASDNNLYALLTPHTRIEPPTEPIECDLVRERGLPRKKLGTLLPAKALLGEEADKLGFFVLRLNELPLLHGVRPPTKPVAIVKNFRNGVWGGGNFKVRRVNDSSWQLPIGCQKNSRLFFANGKGKVIGDIEDVKIDDQGLLLQYSYCGLVNRGRGRPLADKPALGAPVLSSSGALSAIIVGLCENDTLVFPIEELCRDRSIEFVTLGDDFPKVKIGSRWFRDAR